VIILDTDHINVLQVADSRRQLLETRMSASSDQGFATTAITIEEQMRGWLALIHRVADVDRQVPVYQRLVGLFDFFSRWDISHFGTAEAAQFKALRAAGIRIGTMDLEIASIALASDALLLSANLRNFKEVPALRVENWLI
jgi:tRNA(fMet)-specific endonuclease VapC